MKSFKQFLEETNAANDIKSLSPYKVKPGLKEPAPKYGGRRLVDPITGMSPQAKVQSKLKTSV